MRKWELCQEVVNDNANEVVVNGFSGHQSVSTAEIREHTHATHNLAARSSDPHRWH